ncbi:Localization factor PodJL [compost metagenome]
MYLTNKDVQNFEQAFRWARLSAERGYAPAQFQLGQMYRQALGIAQDNKEAVKWYRLSADQGNRGAQCNLGSMYLSGHGVPKDLDQSKHWYYLAAKMGMKAQKNISTLFVILRSHSK